MTTWPHGGATQVFRSFEVDGVPPNLHEPIKQEVQDLLSAYEATLGVTTTVGAVTYRGGYASGTTYAQGDAVTYNGIVYVALVGSNIGNQPDIVPTAWGQISILLATSTPAIDTIAGTPGTSKQTARADHAHPLLSYIIQLSITGGNANIIGCASSPPISAYSSLYLYNFVPNAPNSSVVLLQDNALGFIPVVERDGSPLAPGRLQPHVPYILNYDASTSALKIISPAALEIVPAVDGFNVADVNGNDAGFRISGVGPEIAGARFITGKSEFAIADRFGLMHGNGGDFAHWEVRARDARAVGLSSMERAAFDSNSQRPTFGYNHILTYGQSLEEGASAQASHDALSTAAFGGNLMLGGAPGSETEVNTVFDPYGGASALNALVSLANNTDRGEVPGVGAANMFKYLWLQSQGLSADAARLCVLTACGVGGTTVAQLSSGASPNLYGKITSAMSQLQTLATAASKTIGLAAILWMQGENDYGSGTTSAAYQTALLALIASIRASAASAYGQTGKPPVFTYQTTGGWIFSDILANSIAQAQWLLSKQPNWYLTGPDYQYPHYTGDNHLTSNGYRWMGNKFGQAMHEVLVRGRTWKPLQPAEAVAMGRTVLVTFSVPYAPIQFAPVYNGFSTVLYPSRGFEVYDDIGPLVILGVRIVGQATVGLYCDRPVGNNVHVRYGGTTTNGRGNLCDSDPTIAFDKYIYNGAGMPGGSAEDITVLVNNPYPMNNWCVCFDLAAS